MTTRIRSTLAVALFATGTANAASDYPMSGEKGTIKSFAVACRNLDDTKLIITLARAQDSEAMRKFYLSRILPGLCQELESGTEVMVKDVGPFSDNMCVRPKGEVDCLWINKGKVKAN